MFNYELLKELGRQSKPVLLKRAFSARVKEWLLAAEYVVQSGNKKVILCERGIRTFETSTRNTLDLSGALLAQRESAFSCHRGSLTWYRRFFFSNTYSFCCSGGGIRWSFVGNPSGTT